MEKAKYRDKGQDIIRSYHRISKAWHATAHDQTERSIQFGAVVGYQ